MTRDARAQAWFHATELPPTGAAADGLSVSVARDFRIISGPPQDHVASGGAAAAAGAAGAVDMANVDATWALSEIQEGAVVLTERAAAAVQEVTARGALAVCAECGGGTGSVQEQAPPPPTSPSY